MQFTRVFAIAALASAAYVAASSQETADLENISDAAKSYIAQLQSEHVEQKRSIAGRGQRPVVERSGSTGDCSIGTVSCCNQMVTDAQKKKTLAGLLGVNDIIGQIGLNCASIPINAVGAAVSATNYCKSSPVCCTNVTQNGLVNLGCTSLPIN